MTKEKDDLALKGISVLWEDDNIAAIFKPAGLIVHSDGKSERLTICDFVLERWPETKNVGEPLVLKHESRSMNQESEEKDSVSSPLPATSSPSSHNSKSIIHDSVILRPGIVHRLDRETSGVLLIAKNQDAFLRLKEQFQEREIHKVYNAFVYGKVQKEVGSINLPLGRSKGDFRQYTVPAKARGEMREALTYFNRIAFKEEFSFLELIPKTGRTHQIRAHLKAINHPVVCDRIYAKSMPCALGFDRLALHARSITFRDLSGKEVVVEAPLPDDFIKALELFKNLS